MILQVEQQQVPLFHNSSTFSNNVVTCRIKFFLTGATSTSMLTLHLKSIAR